MNQTQNDLAIQSGAEQDATQSLILSQSDVKSRLGLSRRRQWQLRASGKLSYLDFGGRVGYLPEHLEDYLRRCERQITQEGKSMILETTGKVVSILGSPRYFYEQCRVVCRRPEDWYRPPYCALCRLPLMMIKPSRKYSELELDVEGSDLYLPPEAFQELSQVIRAHGIDEVKGGKWEHGPNSLTIRQVPNAVADDLAFALFETAIKYRDTKKEVEV